MFKNMKLKKRLLCIFLTMCILAGLMCVAAMNHIRRSTIDYDNALVYYGFAQGDIGRAMTLMAESRRLVRDAANYTDPEYREQIISEYATSKQYFAVYRDKIASGLFTDEEFALYDEITAQCDAFYKKADELFERAQSNGANLSLSNEIITDLDPIYNALYEDFNTLLSTKMAVGQEEQRIVSLTSQYTYLTLIVMMAFTLIFCLILAIRTARSISKPVVRMTEIADSLVQGSLDIDIVYTSKDEIGELADSFRAMTNNFGLIISDIIYMLNEMATGNFTVESQNEAYYIGTYSNILDSLKHISKTLNSTLSHINSAADRVGNEAAQVSMSAQTLSQGAVEQASSIEELSATTAEISDQISANAILAEKASSLSTEAGGKVEESNRLMNELNEAMVEITAKADEIGKIIKTIDDIAFQTNILALNAAVEAARAGAAGKGFAVVADEVRNLAQKSAEAASSTTVLIEGTVSAVANGTKFANQTTAALLEVVEKAGNVNKMIGEIAIACEQQADATKQLAAGIEQVSSVVQANSATSQESAAASAELSQQASIMKDLVDSFKLK